MSTPNSWLKSTKKTWGLLTQFAVFILGVVGSFIFPPPGWASSGDKTLVRLGQFIIAVLVGLMFLLVQNWNKKQHVGRWALLALFFLVLSISSFFGYKHFQDTRTCQYDGQTVVIGTSYTDAGKDDFNTTPNATCEVLIRDFVGVTADVWTKESIDKSRYILAGAYILNLPLFTICIIAVVQAISCSQSKARK